MMGLSRRSPQNPVPRPTFKRRLFHNLTMSKLVHISTHRTLNSRMHISLKSCAGVVDSVVFVLPIMPADGQGDVLWKAHLHLQNGHAVLRIGLDWSVLLFLTTRTSTRSLQGSLNVGSVSLVLHSALKRCARRCSMHWQTANKARSR